MNILRVHYAIHTFIIFLFLHTGLGASTQETVDLVVLLSADCSDILKVKDIRNEPCCNELLFACKENQIILVSPSIIYGMLQRKRAGADLVCDCINRIASSYTCFLNKDQDFLLLIPKTTIKNISSLGFRYDQFSRIEPDALMQFSQTKWRQHLIEIDHFKNLFRLQEIGYEPPAKCIYLVSHGSDAIDEMNLFSWSAPRIAHLELWQCVNFLHMLNIINTQFLHIASCYAAGKNIYTVDQIMRGIFEDERCPHTSVPLNFPIMIQGTSDNPVCAIIGKEATCTCFFSQIHEWINEQRSLTRLSELLFSCMFKNMTGCCGPNYPVIKLDQTSSIVALPVEGVIQLVKDAPHLIIDQDTRHIFVYAATLQGTHIHYTSLDNSVSFISKIFGQSSHFISSILIPCHLDEHCLTEFLVETFAHELIRNPEGACSFGLADKAWFIDTLYTTDQSENHTLAQGIIVHKGMLKKATHEIMVLYRDQAGTYHQIQCPLPFKQKMARDQHISQQEYSNQAMKIFLETGPSRDALTYATAGRENLTKLDTALDNFFKNLELSKPEYTIKTLVQQDITQLANQIIDKQKYLSYVAYTHNERIIEELIHIAIGKHDYIKPQDIATVLIKLIDIEQQSLSLAYAHTLLEQKNSELLMAALDTLEYMLQVGLYVHASKACEPIWSVLELMSHTRELTHQDYICIQRIENFFVELIVTLLKKDKFEAAQLILNTMLAHESWSLYGLGLSVSIKLIKQGAHCPTESTQSRIEWFQQQLIQQAHYALATYYAQRQLVETYRHLIGPLCS